MAAAKTLHINLPNNLPGWPLELARSRYSAEHHGDFPKWQTALSNLTELTNTQSIYGDTVTVHGEDASARSLDSDIPSLADSLQQFHPWRKGPFQINEVTINTEWRSDWKWQRIAPHLDPLTGHRVLDIGCGNGYFGWRLLEQGAAEVICIDPTLLFCMQHLAINHFCQDSRNWVLPLKVEELPDTALFDTTLSMGVIYHRRDPQAHVEQLRGLTRPGGTVVLESIITEGTTQLIPKQRYARMRNVWCVPRVADLEQWMHQAGLQNIRTVDVSPTSQAEQRSTDWMRFESLKDCLDPHDPSKTVEGYPAPVRAIVIGQHPG